MSPADSTKPRPASGAKPKADIYTAMLIVAFVALVIGIVCFVMELWDYNGEIKSAALPASSQIQLAHSGTDFAPRSLS